MKPYYEHAGIAIYHGDCREVLPALESVNCVITDPPYEAEAHAAGRRVKGETVNGMRPLDSDPLSFAPMDEDTRILVSGEIARLSQGWALVFCQVEAVTVWRDSLAAFGAAYKRAMVWVKPDSSPQLSGDRPAMGYESIVASWCGNGRSVWNGGGKRGVFIHNKRDLGAIGPNVHQTQKPIRLMRELVSLFSNPGETILDPFMGSGTTLIAAKELGRKAIGVEREEKYCEAAAERLSQEVLTFA